MGYGGLNIYPPRVVRNNDLRRWCWVNYIVSSIILIAIVLISLIIIVKSIINPAKKSIEINFTYYQLNFKIKTNEKSTPSIDKKD